MDFDDVLFRPPLTSHPVSILLHAPGRLSASLPAALGRLLDLARHCPRMVELVVLLDDQALAHLPARWASLPARVGPLRCYWLCRADADQGAGWMAALRATQQTAVVALDVDCRLTPESLTGLLAALDECDAVNGVRAGNWPWWRRLLGWLIRAGMGIPFRDAASPIMALRRETLVDVVLEARGPMLAVERAAKTNFLEVLVDEIPVPSTRADADLLHFLVHQPRDWMRLMIRPRFWNYPDRAAAVRAPAARQLPVFTSPRASASRQVAQLHPQHSTHGGRKPRGVGRSRPWRGLRAPPRFSYRGWPTTKLG